MISSYLNIKGYEKRFDCCHLVALYLRQNLGIPTADWDNVSRHYDLKNEVEYIYEEMLKHGMVEVAGEYKEGDVIIYRAGRRGASAICINDVSAIILRGSTKLIHIERINNKIYHLRHSSLEEQKNV